MSEWVSVKERLPEEYTGVLVFVPPGTDLWSGVTAAQYAGSFGEWHRWWNPHLVGGFESEFDFDTDDITHWMPLPAPPEDGVEVSENQSSLYAVVTPSGEIRTRTVCSDPETAWDMFYFVDTEESDQFGDGEIKSKDAAELARKAGYRVVSVRVERERG